MRRLVVIAAAIATVLVVASIGFWGGRTLSDPYSDAKFDSCHKDVRSIILSYGYGINEDVRTSFKLDAGKLSVRLETSADDGPHIAILLHGAMTIDGYVDVTSVRQHDGSRLPCTPVTTR